QELLPVTCDDVFAAFQVVLGDVIVQREDALAAIIDQQDGGGNPIDLKRPAFLRKFQHGIIGVNTLAGRVFCTDVNVEHVARVLQVVRDLQVLQHAIDGVDEQGCRGDFGQLGVDQ